jgi:hypothetical protein
MKAQRIFRASGKSAEERVREQTFREKLQKEKPSLEDLVRTGECDPDAVMTMGMYFDVQKAIHRDTTAVRRLGARRQQHPGQLCPHLRQPAPGQWAAGQVPDGD